MVIVLLIIGICLVVSSYSFRTQKKNEYDASAIEAFQGDFYDQFKLSQQQLQSLHNLDFSEVRTKLDQLEHQLAELQSTMASIDENKMIQRLNKLQDGIEQLLQNDKAAIDSQLAPQRETVQKPKTESKQQTLIAAETSKKIESYLKLKEQGKSLDEIVKLLQMEKGELLFLENLSKNITNS